MSGTPDLERFGRIVRARREHLGYQQDTMPHGPSSTTVSDIENADITTLAAKTFRKLDESLKWDAGSAHRTYEGGDPTPIEDKVPLELQTVSTDALFAELRRRLADKAEPVIGEIIGTRDPRQNPGVDRANHREERKQL